MNQFTASKRMKKIATTTLRTKEAALVATFGHAVLAPLAGHAEQPPPPCHPNLQANQDMAAVKTRGDVVNLPDPLKARLVRLADRPHSQLPTQIPCGFRTVHSGPSAFMRLNSPSICFSLKGIGS